MADLSVRKDALDQVAWPWSSLLLDGISIHSVDFFKINHLWKTWNVLYSQLEQGRAAY